LALLAAWGHVRPGDLVAALRRLPPATYCAAAAAHVAVYVLRALRFRVLLPAAQRPGFFAMNAIAAAHNLAAYVLPAKTGELALVVYLKTVSGVPATMGMAALIVGRLLDFASFGLALCIVAVWLAAARPDVVPQWLFAAALVPGLGALAALMFALRGDWLGRLLARLAHATGLERYAATRRLVERARGLAQELHETARGGQVGSAALLALAMWLCVFVFFALLAHGFGIGPDVGPAEAVFGSSVAMFTNVLPINALAGFGTQETGWMLGFGLLGVPRDLALSTGIAVHLVQLFNTLVLGILGHLGMGLLPRAARCDTPVE
jgi:uncharacterized protein (TIRG00374 family)